MIRTIIICAAVISLAACSSTDNNKTGLATTAATTPANVSAAAATVSAAVLPPATITWMEGICEKSKFAIDFAASKTMPAKIRETAVYPQAYCRELLAGTVPATTTASTPSWLSKVISAATLIGRVL